MQLFQSLSVSCQAEATQLLYHNRKCHLILNIQSSKANIQSKGREQDETHTQNSLGESKAKELDMKRDHWKFSILGLDTCRTKDFTWPATGGQATKSQITIRPPTAIPNKDSSSCQAESSFFYPKERALSPRALSQPKPRGKE